MSATVHTGDCRDVMRGMEAASFHAICTDPPYGLGFMGRGWDRGVPGTEFWTEVLRVAKPGAHLVAFGGPRTYHRVACAIEDAGWEIRDCLQWLFGSGFPKSADPVKAAWREGGPWPSASACDYDDAQRIADTFDGYGSALKPAYEPIVLARKPLTGTIVNNLLAHGCGALNIDGTRVQMSQDDRDFILKTARPHTAGQEHVGAVMNRPGSPTVNVHASGRWPANLLLGCACEHEHDPGCAVAMLDAQSGEAGAAAAPATTGSATTHDTYGKYAARSQVFHADSGGASRFFYTSKATRAEREAGLEHRQRRVVNDGRQKPIDNAYQRAETERANTHPTVKPVSLMRWLVRLVGGKRGSVILDPFMGSGTTGIACTLEGFEFVGIDLDPEHCEIARARILAASEEAGTATADELASVPDRRGPVQMGLLTTDTET